MPAKLNQTISFPDAEQANGQGLVAVGGDLKNTFCLGEGGYAWLSAHVGDMDDLATLHAFSKAEQHLEQLTGVRPLGDT